MVFAHTTVDAPKNGAISRAAAISAPRVAIPTAKTSSSSGGSVRGGCRGAADSGAAGSVVATALVLVRREVGLAGTADRAEPVARDVVERRSGRDPPVRIPLRRVVYEPTGLADPFLDCGRRHAVRG